MVVTLTNDVHNVVVFRQQSVHPSPIIHWFRLVTRSSGGIVLCHPILRTAIAIEPELGPLAKNKTLHVLEYAYKRQRRTLQLVLPSLAYDLFQLDLAPIFNCSSQKNTPHWAYFSIDLPTILQSVSELALRSTSNHWISQCKNTTQPRQSILSPFHNTSWTNRSSNACTGERLELERPNWQ